MEATPQVDLILWEQLRGMLADNHLLHKKYIVEASGSRSKRWKGNDRELTPDELTSELVEEMKMGHSDGFFLQTLPGQHPAYSLVLYAGNRHGTRLFGFGGSEGTESGLVLAHSAKLVQTIARNSSLICARICVSSYHAWMNQTDIKYYKSKYGSIVGFKIKPYSRPPLDFPILDISLNPGREIITQQHYHMTVAADMWLGPAFWKYAPCTREEALKEPWTEVEETEHYLYLKAYPEPFTRPDGEQGRIQRRLWNVLFHQDCEWPPGSGGIAD